MSATAQQRLQRALYRIMGNPDFIALNGVLMLGKREVISEADWPVQGMTPTAYTNGWDEKYVDSFINVLNDAELRFVVLHECEHKMRRHLTVFQHLWKVDPQCANMAMDYVINRNLKTYEPFIEMPKAVPGLYDPQFNGMNEVQIFNKLREQGQGGQGEGQGTGFDGHDWADAKSGEEALQQARELDAAVRQGALVASKSGAGKENPLIGELLVPQVRWEDELAEFVSTTCTGNDYSTWARCNRRYISQGIYMPSGISEAVGEIVVACDTSGSMWGEPLRRVMTELVALCDLVKPSRVHVLYWDTAVAQAEAFGGPGDPPLDGLLSLSKPAGGGGTNVDCVPDWLRQNGIAPQACVVLTDGEVCGWGQWDWPVLWAVIGNERARPPMGRMIHVKEE